MTPEQIEIERKKFETWFLTENDISGLFKNYNGDYVGWHAHFSFKAWLASRDSLCVTLPEIHICYDSKEEKVRHLDYEDMIFNLQSAGINYRVEE